MRTLVEQTEGEVAKWLLNLRNAWATGQLELSPSAACDLLWLTGTEVQGDPVPSETFSLQPLAFDLFHSPVILMGGEDAGEWDIYPEENAIYPEKPAILIGTQDMLLSRALNRGYAAGRARWPKDFALLNNDCLWVFDEVQLMSTGFATSLQLQAWREHGGMPPALPTFSWWMSATLEKEWLASSVDFSPRINAAWEAVEKEEDLLWNEDAKCKTESGKRLETLLTPGTKTFHSDAAPKLKGEESKDIFEYIKQVAGAVMKNRNAFPGKTILVVVNTVQRACALAEKLEAEAPLLLHSRFRHRERKGWVAKLKTEKLIVATQVCEAQFGDKRFSGALLKSPDVGLLPGMLRGLKLENGVRLIPSLAFCRRRRNHQINGFGRFLVLEFTESRLGRPFAVGSQCHFGLGLFVPVIS